jgi:hypothetical protein
MKEIREALGRGEFSDLKAKFQTVGGLKESCED